MHELTGEEAWCSTCQANVVLDETGSCPHAPEPEARTPLGTPAAGPVKVYRIIDGVKVLVGEQDPLPGIDPGTTLPGGRGQAWARGVDGQHEEWGDHDPDAAAWSDDISLD